MTLRESVISSVRLHVPANGIVPLKVSTHARRGGSSWLGLISGRGSISVACRRSIRPENDATPGGGVFDGEMEFMQRRDGRHKAQTEAGAGYCAGSINAVKASQHGVALFRRNAGAGIADFDTNPVARCDNAHSHRAARWGILDPILDEIADGLE